MVENQRGSSDIAQSTDANVMVRPRSTRPPRLSCSMRRPGPGPCPGVELPGAGGHREEEHRHERQGACARLEQAADYHSPGAARDVVDHQDGEAAERDPDPEQVGDEVGAEELLGANQRAGRRGGAAGDAERERRAAEPVQRVLGAEEERGGRAHYGYPSLALMVSRAPPAGAAPPQARRPASPPG